MIVTSDHALLERVAAEMRGRLAGLEVQVAIEMDLELEEHVVAVEGRDALGRVAWGRYSATVLEADHVRIPLGGMWSAYNDDGQKAHSDRGNLDKFARWWHLRD